MIIVSSLLEDLHGKFDAVAEAVSGVAQDVQSLKADVHSIDDRLDHVEQDITAIKAAVTDQSTAESTGHGAPRR
jgi:uncharacterized protein YoxC